jgi:hypothetical protein
MVQSRPPALPTASPPRTGKKKRPTRIPTKASLQEELPPDLQYSADSSVSFPTNI